MLWIFMFSKSWARNKNHCFQCDLSVLNMRFKIAERFNTNKEHQSVSPFFHSRLFQFRLHKIYLYIFDQAFELTAQRLDIARYRYSYRRLWFLSFSAATIRFVGWIVIVAIVVNIIISLDNIGTCEASTTFTLLQLLL